MATRRTATHLRNTRIVWRSPVAASASPSSVVLGTAYERAAAAFLASAPQYRLKGLVRVGGAGDQGIDLRGRWPGRPSAHGPSQPPLLPRTDSSNPLDHAPTATPSSTLPSPAFPVIVQCKAEASRVGPSTVRELEGTLLSQSRLVTRPTAAHIGILVALSGFSEATIRQAHASALPLALVHLAVGDIQAMVRSQGREGALQLVSASRNRTLEELLRRTAKQDVEGRLAAVEDGEAERRSPLGGAPG
ncbi:hypothetical protein JCM3770_007048 [Rhodotorula araucariae]